MRKPKSVDLPAQEVDCKSASSGSTPATDSILFDAVGGKAEAQKFLKDRAFNKRYQPPNNSIFLGRQLIWQLVEDNKNLRARLAEQGRMISQLKRGSK